MNGEQYMIDTKNDTTTVMNMLDNIYKIDQSQLLSILYSKGYLHGATGVPNIPLIQGEAVSELDIVYNSGYCDGAMNRIGEEWTSCAIGMA